MAVPTQARVQELFNYDPQRGRLVWRERPRSDFATEAAFKSFNARCLGKDAGHIDAGGYLIVRFDGECYKGHKVIWLRERGEWVEYPAFEIDHINGDTTDNRLENLRVVTKSGNQRNAGPRVNNTSGVHGVNWKPVRSSRDGDGRWVARIWNGPRHVYLGSFKTLHEAAIARKAAERVLGFTGPERKTAQPGDKR